MRASREPSSARKHESWAGYYIDQLDRGAPVFLFTADAAAMRSAITFARGGTTADAQSEDLLNLAIPVDGRVK